MISRMIALSLVTVALPTAGCVDTSPDRVKLTTELDDVSLSIQKGALVSVLSGSFDWVLKAGDLTSGDDTIAAAPVFQATDGTGQPAIVLDALPSRDFPLTLKSGDSLSVTFTLSDKNTLAEAALSGVCSNPVTVVGSFRDSLGGDRATSVESASAAVAGCP